MKFERLVQSQGLGSRRDCRKRIRAGDFSVNGICLTDPFADVTPEGAVIEVDGTRWPYRATACLALHKPTGFECSRRPGHHPSIFSLLPEPLQRRGVQPAGRLDQDTSGLLILSDDGKLLHRISHGRRKLPKQYRVTTAAPLTAAQLGALAGPLWLSGESDPVSALAVDVRHDHELLLTIGEGRYHQVRRMLAAVGNHVLALHRQAIGDFRLPDTLAAGQWCWLDEVALRQIGTE